MVVLIPARSGSKSIPDKNLQEVEGASLIAWAARLGRLIVPDGAVFVDTDSPVYAAEAEKSGASVPFLRPAAFATDESSDFETIDAFCSTIKLGPETIVIHLRPTTPLRTQQTMTLGIDTFRRNRDKFTSLRSVHEMPESAHKAFEREPTGELRPIAGNSSSIEESNLPRQSFPATYAANGYIDIFPVANLSEFGSLHGPRVFGFETEFTIEVDSVFELDLIRLLAKGPENSHSTEEK